jgi:hypothetical protein
MLVEAIIAIIGDVPWVELVIPVAVIVRSAW